MATIKTGLVRKAGAAFLALTMLEAPLCAFAEGSSSNHMVENAGKYYASYSSQQEFEREARNYNTVVAEEGFVLLKNKDNALPFTTEKRISVFGKKSVDLILGGSGSGSMDVTEGTKNLYDSLTAAGFTTNPVLQEFYTNSVASGNSAMGSGVGAQPQFTGETPMSNYTQSVLDSYRVYNDAALVVISRGGTEGADLLRGNLTDNTDPQKHYLELGDNELAMIAHVKANFDKVIVVLNSSNAFELGDLEADDEIDAIVWIGNPGAEGIMALGEILNGSVNPSGRTVDIFPADFTSDPTYQNFSDNSQTGSGYMITVGDAGQGEETYARVDYEEGIYYGYNYYETRGFEEDQKQGVQQDTWYQQNVVYPFGYGLSYTSFDYDVVWPEEQKLNKDGTMDIQVTVTNSGSVAGKEVVQVYFTAPYTAGEVEKSYVTLAAFDKTKLLQPGEAQTLTLSFKVAEMASYDYNDANSNGHIGYELDAGTYEIKVMKDSHTKIAGAIYTLSEDALYDVDPVTGLPVENRFSNDDKYNSLDADTHLMSRADFEGTFPTAPTAEELDWSSGHDKQLETLRHVFSLTEDESGEVYYNDFKDVPDSYTQEKEDTAIADRNITLTFADMAGVDKQDEKWVTFMNQLKWSEVVSIAQNGFYTTEAIEAVGKPKSTYEEGPAGQHSGVLGWPSACVQAATFNTELLETIGQLCGEYNLWLDADGWTAPAMNIHRSPFAGRNFEYYSQDAFHSGKIAAAFVKGLQSKGTIPFVKHFALNNQETNRSGLVTFADEQTIREVYLKNFKYVVSEGKAMGIMSSLNRIGLMSNVHNYQLLTGVLRDEWGFEGAIVTDWWMGGPNHPSINSNMIVRAGNDLPLGVSGIQGSWDANARDGKGNVYFEAEDGTKVENLNVHYMAVRKAAMNALYSEANTNLQKNLLDLNAAAQTSALDGVVQGTSYEQSVAVPETVGTTDVTYELVAGALPQGIVLNKYTGVLSGTANGNGVFDFTVRANLDKWMSVDKNYSITVDGIFTSTASTEDAPQVIRMKRGEAQAVTLYAPDYPVENFNKSYSVTLAEGYALPAGLTLTEDGMITGAAAYPGDYTIKINVNAVSSRYMWGTYWDTAYNFCNEYTLSIAE